MPESSGQYDRVSVYPLRFMRECPGRPGTFPFYGRTKWTSRFGINPRKPLPQLPTELVIQILEICAQSLLEMPLVRGWEIKNLLIVNRFMYRTVKATVASQMTYFASEKARILVAMQDPCYNRPTHESVNDYDCRYYYHSSHLSKRCEWWHLFDMEIELQRRRLLALRVLAWYIALEQRLQKIAWRKARLRRILRPLTALTCSSAKNNRR
ncbi:MAG: hypothetical protein Q9159_004830 [Coniocarpon cinnabarinum]